MFGLAASRQADLQDTLADRFTSPQADIDGISRKDLEQRLVSGLPEINRQLPGYAQIKKIEFMPEDFERTPKRSIKRYLYQRN